MQVGLEEKENLTVTWNVSIAIRSLCVVLLAAILALVFVATSAEDADARKVRHKKGGAAFVKNFTPPDPFSCRFRVRKAAVETWDGQFDGYRCTAVGTTFLLNDKLERTPGTPPPGPFLTGLATPDLFKCHGVNVPSSLPPGIPEAARGLILAEHFSCEFSQNQQTRVFKVSQIVSTNRDDRDVVPTKFNIDRKDLFLPPAGTVVPTAVPAGADAGGEGSAAWPFGLVLAAGGAIAGTVVIARRRFLHDS